jgi:hypothetical protein
MPGKLQINRRGCSKLAIASFFSVSITCIMSPPIPSIQSPRIIAPVSLASSAYYSPTEYHLSLYGKKPDITNSMYFSYPFLPELILGINNKVEFSGFLFVPKPSYYLGLTAKVPVLSKTDYSDLRLFRNYAMSIRAGFQLSNGQSLHAGIILGTRMQLFDSELELVALPTCFLLLNGYEFSRFDIGIDNTFGMLYWPLLPRKIQFTLGGTIRTILLRRDEYYYNSQCRYGNAGIYVVPILQASLAYNFSKKKR